MKIVNHILVLLVVVVADICNANGAPAPVCWKDSYGRGVGKPISSCDASKGLSEIRCALLSILQK